jgi:hypothetical protein
MPCRGLVGALVLVAARAAPPRIDTNNGNVVFTVEPGKVCVCVRVCAGNTLSLTRSVCVWCGAVWCGVVWCGAE